MRTSAAERWYERARAIYAGPDEVTLFDRALRPKGDVDRAVFGFLLLDKLERLCQALEAHGKSKQR